MPLMRDEIKKLITEAPIYKPNQLSVTSNETKLFISFVNFSNNELFTISLDKQLANYLKTSLEKELC